MHVRVHKNNHDWLKASTGELPTWNRTRHGMPFRGQKRADELCSGELALVLYSLHWFCLDGAGIFARTDDGGYFRLRLGLFHPNASSGRLSVCLVLQLGQYCD